MYLFYVNIFEGKFLPDLSIFLHCAGWKFAKAMRLENITAYFNLLDAEITLFNIWQLRQTFLNVMLIIDC